MDINHLSHPDFDLNRLIEFRHELHSYPELSFQEFDTKRRLLDYLNKLPLFQKHAKITETSTPGFWVDIYGTGNQVLEKDILISFRTDLDALPVTETGGKPYASKNTGVAHVCGHDGHMTIIVGTIEYYLLNISKFPKNFGVRFLFQPAEEIVQGALQVIKDGCLVGVAEMYGLHNIHSFFNAGEIGCCHGVIFAGVDTFHIKVKGRGGHGSTPHLCRNPIIPAASITLALKQIPSQEVSAKESCVVSIGNISSGTKENVIPDEAIIKGTVRSMNKETASFVKNRITEISTGIAKVHSCEAEVAFPFTAGATINGKTATDLVIAIVEKHFKLNQDNLPVMASEDFSEYAYHVPSCFFLLGGGDEEHTGTLHTTGFDFNDKTLHIGIEVFLRVIEAKAGVSILN